MGNSKMNSMPNKEELLMPPRTKRSSKENSRKSSMLAKKTRRTLSVSKTWLTNSKSRSRPTRDKLKKLKNKVTPTWPNSERFNTNSTSPKKEPIWLKPHSQKPDPRQMHKYELFASYFMTHINYESYYFPKRYHL